MLGGWCKCLRYYSLLNRRERIETQARFRRSLRWVITPSLIGGNRESQSSRPPCSAGEASFCLGKRKARLDRVETSWTMADGEGEATGRMESIADISVVSGNRRKTGDRQ